MQAITTKFVGPTNHRGSRVTARAQAGKVTVSWDHALDIDANHDQAALALIRKFGWSGTWHRGGMPGGEGNVYVCGSRYSDETTEARIFDPYSEPEATRGPWRCEGGCVYAGEVRIAIMDREEPGTRPVERDANARLIASMR
jgi:hypothetical protein